MPIVCDLLTSILPELSNQIKDFRQPDFPPLLPHYDPRIYLYSDWRKIGSTVFSAKNHAPRNLSSTKF